MKVSSVSYHCFVHQMFEMEESAQEDRVREAAYLNGIRVPIKEYKHILGRMGICLLLVHSTPCYLAYFIINRSFHIHTHLTIY